MNKSSSKFTTKLVNPKHGAKKPPQYFKKMWNDIETLFGSNGACGGCWCMFWRQEKGESWESVKGLTAKARFKKLVTTGKIHGVLAYEDNKPIGWCSFDRRVDYPKLDRAPSFKCDDANEVWSVPCFYVHKDYRETGVGSLLLKHAIKSMRELGAQHIEGYPVKPPASGKKIPYAFAWTGTKSLFEKLGFKVVGNKEGGKQRVRLK